MVGLAERSLGIKVVTALYAIGAFALILGGLAFLVMGAALMETMTKAGGAGFAFIGGFIGFVLLFFGIIDAVVAYGVWNMLSWGRIAASVFSVLALFSIPFGTIFGIVELYFLWFDEKTKNLFK